MPGIVECQMRRKESWKLTHTHMVNDHNRITSRPVSELLHETVEDIVIVLDRGVRFIENVLAKSYPYTNK
jgi:hypothetical protein